MIRYSNFLYAILFSLVAWPVCAEETAPEVPHEVQPKKRESLPKMPTGGTSYDLFIERGNTAGSIGVAAAAFGVAETGGVELGLGLSGSILQFYKPPADFHHTTYIPVYGFLYGCRVMTLNPCFEFGLDLGNALESGIPRLLGTTDKNDCCDVYASIGLSGRPINRMRVFTYLKAMIINYDYVYSESKSFVPVMLGVRLGYQ